LVAGSVALRAFAAARPPVRPVVSAG
jgi:hypothetical protein